MYQVKGEFPHYNAHSLKSYFYLNADQAFNPYTWKPPIKWEGIVGSQKVKFTQTNSSSYDITCFDWSEFPEELSEAKSHIVEAIDNAMRIMD